MSEKEDLKINIHGKIYHTDPLKVTNSKAEPIITENTDAQNEYVQPNAPELCEYKINKSPDYSKDISTDAGITVKASASYTYNVGRDNADNAIKASVNVAKLDYYGTVYNFAKIQPNSVKGLPKECVVNLINAVNEQFDKDITKEVTFPKELKGFNRSNDVNGNAVIKAFYKDNTSEMIRGGKVMDFCARYGVKTTDYNKSYKTVDGLRNSSLKSAKSIEER